jgi:surfactin synthase thioesterase subunit
VAPPSRTPVRHGAALWRYAQEAPVAVRLICLPHAGGGAFLQRRWPDWLPPSIEVVSVELPGRGTRMREPPATDLRVAAASLEADLASLADLPLAIFGHSMGAILAFELALRRQRLGQTPLAVFLAGCAAPERLAERPNIHALDDDAFLARLVRLEAIPAEVLADPDLRAMVLGILRADITMLEAYVGEKDAVLDCPVWVLGGREDDAATATDLLQWRDHARGGFEHADFPGGHFFVNSEAQALVDFLGTRLSSFLR